MGIAHDVVRGPTPLGAFLDATWTEIRVWNGDRKWNAGPEEHCFPSRAKERMAETERIVPLLCGELRPCSPARDRDEIREYELVYWAQDGVGQEE